jgi:hypothetical protein
MCVSTYKKASGSGCYKKFIFAVRPAQAGMMRTAAIVNNSGAEKLERDRTASEKETRQDSMRF